MNVFVIAEAGVNHNGDPDLALRLVDAAGDAGADAVKFQTFRAEELAIESAGKAAYQNQTTDPEESQLEMLRKLELSAETHRLLMPYSQDRGLVFLSTPFDLQSLAFLTDDLDLKTLKLPSGEITNGPLLLAAARSGRRIILSTGMSSLDEVREALAVIAFGYLGAETPSRRAFAEAFETDAGQNIVKERVTLLHCTSQYPAAFADVNLKAMDTLRDAFGTRVGYSDHTTGTAIAIAAAARGADVIEKHFTLDRSLPGPDHRASLEPPELENMVAGIRQVCKAIGDGSKVPCRSEADVRSVVRKSLVTLAPVAAGEPFTVENLGIKRPGGGNSPMTYWEHLGRAAERDFDADEVIIHPDCGNTGISS